MAVHISFKLFEHLIGYFFICLCPEIDNPVIALLVRYETVAVFIFNAFNLLVLFSYYVLLLSGTIISDIEIVGAK